MYVKVKLCEANNYLFIIKGLRRGGWRQDEIDLLFKEIVLAKITYGLPVYSCFKRRHISKLLDIRQLLEESDRKLFQKISTDSCHPLHSILPRVKESSIRLRCNSSLLPKVKSYWVSIFSVILPDISMLMKLLRRPPRDYISWYNLRELRLLALI